MKNLTLFALALLFLVGCQNASTTEEETTNPTVDLSRYPVNFQKVLEQHGGLERWISKRTLSYERVNSAGNEVHYIDLQQRHDKIEAPNFKMGFDGEQYWVDADTSFKRDPIFYHNLIFYFYSMPFVLADAGIQYKEVEPLVYDSISYPGVAMQFGADVGSSPKDDYIVYYNPETFQMEWLAYTATYFSNERSSKFSYIRYNNWGNFDGVVLPNAITWYRTDEDGNITEARNTVEFEKVSLQETPYAENFFAAPPNARISE